MQLNGLMNVLGASQLPGVRRALIASSSTVYSGLPKGPYREDMLLPVESRSATEAFKKATEIVALHYAQRAGADIGLFRMRSVYGPLYYSLNNPFSRMCHAAVHGVPAGFGGGPVAVHGGGAGHHPAPYEDDEAEISYIKDLVEGIFLMWQAEKLPNRIYNIGPGRAFRYRDMADAVRKVVPGASIGLTPGKNPAGTPKHAFLDISRIRNDLGYQPRFSDIDAAAFDYIGWLKDHEN
ncbi:MAG: NAD(P)-dependent oxidoreductase [Dehalococcoidia bacterium]|nr:NAD(P)-dependent oxidoreductase [Dehalococcoidia bacterium]